MGMGKKNFELGGKKGCFFFCSSPSRIQYEVLSLCIYIPVKKIMSQIYNCFLH